MSVKRCLHTLRQLIIRKNSTTDSHQQRESNVNLIQSRTTCLNNTWLGVVKLCTKVIPLINTNTHQVNTCFMAEPISSILKQLSVSLTEVISSLILIFHFVIKLHYERYFSFIGGIHVRDWPSSWCLIFLHICHIYMFQMMEPILILDKDNSGKYWLTVI